MIFNTIILNLFLIILLLYGNLITKLYPKNFDRNDIHYLSSRLTFGLFFLGSLTFIYNFIGPVFTYSFLFILIIFLSISIFLYLKENDGDNKNYTIFLILIFFSIPFIFYSNQLIPGYDGGLYHIPHQVIIRDEKIAFGLSNIHSRYGLSTFYNYISSLLWYKNNFTIVSLFQSVYLIIFFIFLYELIKHELKLLTITVVAVLLTMPIWFRYNIPGFSLVDLSYGIFFFIALVLSTMILLNKNEFNRNKYFIFFLIICSLCFMHKSNGAQLFPLVLIVIYFKFVKNELTLSDFLKIVSIPLIVLIFWIIRTVIISGCLVFPVELTCFNFWWVTEQEAQITLGVISSWAKRGFSVLEINSKFIGLIIFTTFISSIFYFKKNLINKIHLKEGSTLKRLLLLVISITLFSIYFEASDLRGFSSIVTSGDQFLFKEIIFKEIILLSSVNLLSILFVLVFSNLFSNFNPSLNKNFISKISSIYVFLYLLLWFLMAPNPRFAIGAFALIAPCFVIIFFNNFLSKSNKNLNMFTRFLLICFILKFTLFDAYINNAINLIEKSVPEPQVVKREFYGVSPIDILIDNRCWKVKYCYSDGHDVLFKNIFLDYKVYYKKN